MRGGSDPVMLVWGGAVSVRPPQLTLIWLTVFITVGRGPSVSYRKSLHGHETEPVHDGSSRVPPHAPHEQRRTHSDR